MKIIKEAYESVFEGDDKTDKMVSQSMNQDKEVEENQSLA